MQNVKKTEIIILLISSITMIAIGIIFFDGINLIDISILKFIRGNITYDILKDIMYIISMILTPIPMVIIFLTFSFVIKEKMVPLFIASNAALSVIVNFILKNIFRRQRPIDYMLIDVTGYSFPSAHAMVSAAFYGALIYCNNRYIKSKKVKIMFNMLLWSLLVLTPISRVYLGVHNFTDVFVGSILGILIIKISIYVFEKIELFKKNKEEAI